MQISFKSYALDILVVSCCCFCCKLSCVVEWAWDDWLQVWEITCRLTLTKEGKLTEAEFKGLPESNWIESCDGFKLVLS